LISFIYISIELEINGKRPQKNKKYSIFLMSDNMEKNEKYDQIITLKDGRKLGYAEFGTPEGMPIFVFHGHGSSRLEITRLFCI